MNDEPQQTKNQLGRGACNRNLDSVFCNNFYQILKENEMKQIISSVSEFDRISKAANGANGDISRLKPEQRRQS